MATLNVAAIIIGAIASITVCLMLILFSLFFIHRRRQRAIFIISLAQEEANRRRRKRKKAGLRRWEIESACPEAIVSTISDTVSAPTVHSQQDHPRQYQSAMAALRSANLLPDLAALREDSDLLKNHPAKSLAPPPLTAAHSDALDYPASEHFASTNARSFIVVDVNSISPADPPASDVIPEDDVANANLVPSHVATLPHADEICVICLDDIEVGHRVRILPCRHLYHSQCIRMWLRRKNACPCCSEKVIKHRSKKLDSPTSLSDQSPTNHDHHSSSFSPSEHHQSHHHHQLDPLCHPATDNHSQMDHLNANHTPVQPSSLSITPPPSAQWPERHDHSHHTRRTAIKTIHTRGRALQVYTSTTNSDGLDQVTCEIVRPHPLSRHSKDHSQGSELLLQLQDAPLHDSSLSLNASSTAGWSDAHSDAPDCTDAPNPLSHGASSRSTFSDPISIPNPTGPDHSNL